MKVIHIKNWRFLIFTGLFLGILSTGFAQAVDNHVGEIDMVKFQEKALEEKEEIWVVDFWASWCGPCRYSMPELRTLRNKYAGKAVRVISISWDDRKPNWLGAMKAMGMDWDQILIPNIRNTPFLDEHFPHKGIPAIFVVSKAGKVMKARDAAAADKKIQKLLKKG